MKLTFDSHIHTPLCGHAIGEPDELVDSAHEKGLELITFTCHVPMSDPAFGGPSVRMDHDDLPRYKEFVDAARAHAEPLGIEVRYGIEAEIFPDDAIMEEMDEILSAERFDFILGSLHHQVPAYRQWIASRGLETDDEIIRHYFKHLEHGVASGRYHSVAHPDLIRIYHTIKGPFDAYRYEEEIRGALSSAARHGVCWEMNTSGKFKGEGPFIHPHPTIFGWAVEEGVNFTVGSDTHSPAMLTQGFDDVRILLREHGVNALWTFKGGKPEERIVNPPAKETAKAPAL